MDDLELKIEHDAWANDRLVERMTALGIDEGPPVRLLAHIAAAHLLWQDRIMGRASRVPVQPEVGLAATAALAAEASALWRDLRERVEAEPERMVAYVNSKGVAYRNRVSDILAHVFLHAQYHRGQINAWLRREGHEPALIDFIVFLR